MTIITSVDGDTFELSDEDEKALDAAITRIESGSFVSGDELLRRIDKRG